MNLTFPDEFVFPCLKQKLLDFYMNLRLNSGGSRPFDKEGGGEAVPKNFFRPFGPKFGLKIRGLAPPLDLPLLKGAARVVCLH